MLINNSTSPAVFAWEPACWLRVTGSDALSFLQGQFTNDLRGLTSASATYGLWLTLKGKVLADSFVLCGAAPEEFWIGSYFSAASIIRERLESHIIADDVAIEDVTAEWTGVSVIGTTAATFLESAPPRSFVFPGRRDRSGGLECVYPRDSDDFVSRWRTDPNVQWIGHRSEMEYRRINAGIPAVPSDIGPGDLPNEGGLEADAISYTKGCYLGQEVMARLKSMGQVRRRLLRVRSVATGSSIPPTPPTPLFYGGRQVGELRSAAADAAGGWIGFAMVSLLHVTADATFAFTVDGAAALRLIDQP